MLRAADNELLTRTDAGTGMGELFRRFWVPALLSQELPEPDCPPVRVKIMGEAPAGVSRQQGPRRPDGAAMRTSARQPVLGPQRAGGYPLRVPRLEVRRQRPLPGNADGCAGPATKNREEASLKAYPTREAGGFIWTYMGPPKLKPELPQMEFMTLPPAHTFVVEEAAAMQLGAGLRGRAGYRAFLVSPHVGRRRRGRVMMKIMHQSEAAASGDKTACGG